MMRSSPAAFPISRSEERRVGKECRSGGSPDQAEDGIRDLYVTGVRTCALPIFAISIALRRGDDVIAGIIYNPITDELFAAERGRGAYLNDRRMRVAARRDMHDAVIACGIPHLEIGRASCRERV